MTLDELLNDIKSRTDARGKLTIELAQLASDMAIGLIKDLDMVSVIRCKDCKHSESFPYGTREKRYCNLHDTTMRENDFCSRGEENDSCNMYDVFAREITKENT